MLKCHDDCKFMKRIPGDCHVGCSKPDYTIKANPHGMKNGWFSYPLNFDPIWGDSKCKNYEKESKNGKRN